MTATSPQAEFLRLAREGGRAALATVIGPEGSPALGRKLLVTPDGLAAGGLGQGSIDAAATDAAAELLWAERSETRELGGLQVFIDVVAPAPRLLILGAVDYAAALCKLARASGWRPFVCDPRKAFATKVRFPEAEEVVAAWPDEAFGQLGIDRATYIAILTHDPKLDDAALQIALRSEAAYVGAMGSRRAQDKRRARLLEAGMTDAEIDRMAAPIGLDLGAVTPRRPRSRSSRRSSRSATGAAAAGSARAGGGSTRSELDRRGRPGRRRLDPLRLAQAACRPAGQAAARARARRDPSRARDRPDRGRARRAGRRRPRARGPRRDRGRVCAGLAGGNLGLVAAAAAPRRPRTRS